jgi:hypothetical protein
VRIDGTHGMESRPLKEPPAAPKAAAGAPQQSGAPEGVELLPSQQAYVAQAAAAEELDQQAVAAARELLRTGQLDTPEAVQRAAEALLKFGP